MLTGGQEPEDFETIVRRYVATAPNVKRNIGDFSRTLRNLMKIMFTPTLNVDRFARAYDFPQIANMRLAVDSPDWRETHI